MYAAAFNTHCDRALEMMADALAEKMGGKSEDDIRSILQEYSRTTLADAHVAAARAVAGGN